MLFYPLTQTLCLLLLALLCWLFRWRRLLPFLLLGGFAHLYLFSTGAISDCLMAWLERDYPPRAAAELPQADAIVVLGGATRGMFHPLRPADLNAQADRLLYAARLYREGLAPLVLVSGGIVGGETPEADLMATHLEAMGVPREAMWLEAASRTTLENARFSLARLKELDAHRVLLVTSAFHMRRAMLVFNNTDIEIVPAPTDYQIVADSSALSGGWWPSAGALQRSTLALHEIAGYRVYRLRRWWETERP